MGLVYVYLHDWLVFLWQMKVNRPYRDAMGIVSWRLDFKWIETALAELVGGWSSYLKTTASSKFRNNLQVVMKVANKKHVETSILKSHKWRAVWMRNVKTFTCDEDEQTGRTFLSINVRDNRDMQWNPEPWTPTILKTIRRSYPQTHFTCMYLQHNSFHI